MNIQEKLQYRQTGLLWTDGVPLNILYETVRHLQFCNYGRYCNTVYIVWSIDEETCSERKTKSVGLHIMCRQEVKGGKLFFSLFIVLWFLLPWRKYISYGFHIFHKVSKLTSLYACTFKRHLQANAFWLFFCSKLPCKLQPFGVTLNTRSKILSRTFSSREDI